MKKYWELAELENEVFWVCHFDFFFFFKKEFFFCFLPMKIGQSFLGIKDGSKFWWLPWSKITPSKHFSRQCRCSKRPKLHQNGQISQRSIWITLALWWERNDSQSYSYGKRIRTSFWLLPVKNLAFFPISLSIDSLMHDDRRFFYCIRAVSCCTLVEWRPRKGRNN